MAQLWQKCCRTVDWPRHKLREERHIRRIRQQIVFHGDFAAIDVDDVADRFECEERQSDRQHPVEIRHSRDVFEGAQHAQIDQQTDAYQPTATMSCQLQRNEIIDNGHHAQTDEKIHIETGIEAI